MPISLVKIAFDLNKIATEFFFPLSFRERPKIKYIKSLPKSTHGKDVIFYHKNRVFPLILTLQMGCRTQTIYQGETIKVSSRYELKYQ